jgi:hypothetical protein
MNMEYMMNSLGLWEIQLIGHLSNFFYYDKRSTQSFEIPSFFFTNNIGASQGDLLGFIYPFLEDHLIVFPISHIQQKKPIGGSRNGLYIRH